jgi:hypothetical protein
LWHPHHPVLLHPRTTATQRQAGRAQWIQTVSQTAPTPLTTAGAAGRAQRIQTVSHTAPTPLSLTTAAERQSTTDTDSQSDGPSTPFPSYNSRAAGRAALLRLLPQQPQQGNHTGRPAYPQQGTHVLQMSSMYVHQKAT